jgi:hypothetical protein
MFRSVSTIVIAPARTGRDKTRRNVVTMTVHTKSLTWLIETETFRRFLVVAIKLMDPKIELIPAK